MELVKQCIDLATNPRHTWWICSFFFVADAVLCTLVVWKVPYTEIDWKAYMQQVAQFVSGQRDYAKIYGDTGPLVYPAAHVYIYRLLYAITGEGQDIKLGQNIFVGLYLATLYIVMQCYRQAGVPPYIFPLLILSKRLHSIFLLRLFNDGFAVFFLFLTIFCYQRRSWTLGTVAYSVGLAVKMSLILALPAIGIVLWQGVGRNGALRQAIFIAQIQLLLGYPFIATSPRSYFTRAFEFSRQFLFKWTVNWRFIGEERFLSPQFSWSLLAAHATLLSLFISTSWLHVRVPGAIRQLIHPPPQCIQDKISKRLTPDSILGMILTAVTVGCLCARSLHYQFYAYIAWSTPFLLWRIGMPPIFIYTVWAAQELAWNVYPSTDYSSMVVVGCLKLTVLGVLVATDEEVVVARPNQTKQSPEQPTAK